MTAATERWSDFDNDDDGGSSVDESNNHHDVDDSGPRTRRSSSSVSAYSVSSTARRVQLTVKHSIIGNLLLSSPSPSAATTATTIRRRSDKRNTDNDGSSYDDDDTDPYATRNIDEAMNSLYSNAEGENGFGLGFSGGSSFFSSSRSQSHNHNHNNNNNSSFLHHQASSTTSISSYMLDESDWVLDGCQEWDEDAQQSAVVLQQMQDSSNLDLILMRQLSQRQLQQQQEEEEEDGDNDEFEFEFDDDDDDDDDIEFGAFQSAGTIVELPPQPLPEAAPAAEVVKDDGGDEEEEEDDDDNEQEQEETYREEKKQEEEQDEECCSSDRSSSSNSISSSCCAEAAAPAEVDDEEVVVEEDNKDKKLEEEEEKEVIEEEVSGADTAQKDTTPTTPTNAAAATTTTETGNVMIEIEEEESIIRNKALLDSDEEEEEEEEEDVVVPMPQQQQQQQEQDSSVAAVDDEVEVTSSSSSSSITGSSSTPETMTASVAAADDPTNKDPTSDRPNRDDDCSSSPAVTISSVTTAENRCEHVRLSIERELDTNLSDFQEQQQQQDTVLAVDTPMSADEEDEGDETPTASPTMEDGGIGGDSESRNDEADEPDIIISNNSWDDGGSSPMPKEEEENTDDDEERGRSKDESTGDSESISISSSFSSLVVVDQVEGGGFFDEEAHKKAAFDATAKTLNRLLPDEGTPKVSLILPIDDLSSLEARFARRLQLLHNQQQQQQDGRTTVAPLHKVEQDITTDIEDLDLPSYYFAHDFDDTIRVLESLPWRCLRDYHPTPSGGGGRGTKKSSAAAGRQHHHRRNSSSDMLYESSEWELWEESMVSRLCDLDAALECVNSHLLHQIQPHERQIRNLNDIAHELERNLQLAFMYWDRSWQALENAAAGAVGEEDDGEEQNEDSGLIGPSVLLEAWDHRDDYVALQGALDELATVFEKEQDMFQRIENFDTRQSDALNEYYAVSKLSSELEETVRNGRLSNLDCLSELRDRLGTTNIRFWERLLSLSESVVVGSCRRKCSNFNWMVEYERLVKAVLDLHSSDAFDAEAAAATANHHGVVVDVAKDWSQSIFDALCHEADRALASALLEPTDNDGEQPSSPSEFERELTHFAYEFNCGWGDDAKLRTLVHNLVTIRFCFESSSSNGSINTNNYLPRVFHGLLAGLADVLHTHYLFTQWHSVPFDDRSRNFEALHGVSCEAKDCSSINSDLLESILANLIDSRAALWSRCEAVIVTCLSEYLDFANRPKLFQTGEDGRVDDSAWLRDLQGLHQVLCLSDQFLSLKGPFIGDKSPCGLPALKESGSQRDDSFYEKLGLVFRKHLRSVHVEAMEAMGRMLANESWILTRSAFENRSSESSCTDIGSLLLGAFRSSTKINEKTTPIRVSEVSSDQEVANPFALFPKQGNPFGTAIRTCTAQQEVPPSSATPTSETHSQSYLEAKKYIHKVLSAPAADNRDERLIAPMCVSDGLIAWFSRLVDITTLLPPIVEDVSAVFADVCDLFLTTTLRLCSACSKNERILLGVEHPSPFLVLRNDSTGKTPRNASRDARSPIFSSFRKSTSKAKNRAPTRAPSFLPAALEAEICTPLQRDVASVSRLSAFLMRAQDSLRDVVNLDKVDNWLVDPVQTTETLEEHICGVARLLEKRQGAIWSCFVVAALADVALSEAKTRLSSAFLGSDYEEDLLPLTSYVRVMLEITPDFAALVCRFSCVRAIGGFDVVKAVQRVGAGWEECKLHEHANDYIDELGDRCALIWGFLCVSAKLPFVVRKTIWCQICSGAYLSLLEGFARVPFCSTEGRALMALDLASFSAGISSASITDRLEELALVASPPPPVNPERSEGYVDTYIKVFYYPMEDVMAWIEKNYRDYQLGHLIALVTGATASLPGSSSSDNDVSEMVERIMQLYGRNDNDASATNS